MQRAVEDPAIDFLFGLAGNQALSPLAELFLAAHRGRLETARRAGLPLPTPTRTYISDRLSGRLRAAGPLKAEVMALGDNPRFVVTPLDLPTPECLYRDL